ncbi:MAG: carboxypeptidase regulatory-like domain-containing protein, partial [Acidobacteriota bacterium]|nr:carboxypeptidase regulatory-like domain-containing protein [Acidobacteriota bacterium]
FSTKQVLELPAPGGDLTTVAFTVPGIAVSTGMGYGNFSSHGLPGTSNLFTINGNDYNDAYLNLNNSGASNLLLGQNEVTDASVVQNGYSVQYGRGAGAQVNYVTKGGTNALHGDLLFNFNNHLMNANDFFANQVGTPRPYAVSRQWAADIGGPVIKNKLFFYSDSEGLYYALPSVHTVVLPSQLLQSYILQNVTPAQGALYQKAFGVYNNAPGAKSAPLVTNGSGPLQDSTGNLGCGALAGVAVPSLLGSGTFGTGSNSCANAFGASGLNTNKEWLETHRVDWNINDKQKVFFRFKGDHGFQPTGTNLLSPSLNLQSIQPQYEGQINHTYVISPSTVNNFIISILYYSAIFGPSSVSASQSVFPSYFQIGGSGGTNTAGFYPVGVNWTAFPQGRKVGQGQIVDDLSTTKGNHSLKLGVNFRKNRVTDYSYESGSIGSYLFANVSDFANGETGANSAGNGTSTYQQKFSPLLNAHIRLYNIGMYAQDEWAVRPNLKVTLGIRLDRTGNPSCLDKCFSLLNQPFTSSAFQTGADIPYNSSINTGLTHAYYNVDSIVPDPRLGIVWSPRGANGTVIRGGIGLFSDLSPGVLVSSVFNNAPFPYNANIGTTYPVDLAGNPASAAAAAQNQFNAFKTGFFGGQTLAQLNSSVPGGFNPFPYFSVPQKLLTPNYIEWSFELQQPVGQKNVLVATYSGNHGYNLLVQNGWPNAFLQSGYSPGFSGLPSAAPDSRFAAVTQLSNGGISNYDGLSVQFRRTFAYGFQGEASYTWSHALDTISNDGAGLPYSFCSGCGLTTLSSPNVQANYGNADYDIRHNFTADFIWDTPWKFGNKILGNILGNWTVSGKFFWRTGTPFSIIDGALAGSVAGTNVNATMLATTLGPLPTNCGGSAVNTACYSASQFVASGAETAFGNVGRNSLHGPNYSDVDATLFKNFTVKEHYRFQIGASAYNVLNHPNFQNPNADISAPSSFGTISATAIPPTSAYGSFQGSAVSGRVLVVTGRFQF